MPRKKSQDEMFPPSGPTPPPICGFVYRDPETPNLKFTCTRVAGHDGIHDGDAEEVMPSGPVAAGEEAVNSGSETEQGREVVGAEAIPEERAAISSAPTAAIEVRQPATKAVIAVSHRGIEVSTLDELWRLAQYAIKAGLAPKVVDTPEKALIAMQFGMELGLRPITGLQNIKVVNGIPSLWGDMQLGQIRESGLLAAFREWYEIDGNRVDPLPPYPDNLTAVCLIQRKGYDFRTERFSVLDAKRAKLWGKAGPWCDYPMRMLRMRARGFATRDEFQDVLKGVKSTEEVMDYPEEAFAGRDNRVADLKARIAGGGDK